MSSKFDSFFKRLQTETAIKSQNALARELGINRSSVTQAKRLDQIPDKWLLQLFRKYQLNPDWLESGRGRPFLYHQANCDSAYTYVPKVQARLCAGDGSFETSDNISSHFAFQSVWLKSKGVVEKMVLVDISGNSMVPELKGGDTVLIDQTQKDIIAGEIYAVGIEDTIMVKRLEKQPGKLVLRSDNPDYAPIILSQAEIEAVRIIGRMVWACREF